VRDALAGWESPHFALALLADFAATLAQDFLLAQDGVASLTKGIGGRFGALSHGVALRRPRRSIKLQTLRAGKCGGKCRLENG
jgi:hypothetical protein